MSTTSGPIVPDCTGNSMDWPSPYVSLAFFVELMVFPWLVSATLQHPHHFAERGVAALAAPADQAPELVVGVVEQGLEGAQALAFEQRAVRREEALEDEVVLEQATPATPAQTVHFCAGHAGYTERFTISSLILPMALVGLRFFGQASTQFMML